MVPSGAIAERENVLPVRHIGLTLGERRRNSRIGNTSGDHHGRGHRCGNNDDDRPQLTDHVSDSA
jgi:hypothetical protein